MAEKTGRLHIGTSGYQYDHWKGVFYPEKMPKKAWFDHYRQHFNTVEINNTFYNLPKAETFARWRQAATEDFRFILKYSRYGSHIKRLKDPETHVDHFVGRAGELGDLLGPVLVQLPPRWRPDPGRLNDFLAATPDDWSWAVEFRDERWLNEAIYDVLHRHGAALCIHDMIENHPAVLTTDWTYLRFHGKNGGNYARNDLAASARRIGKHLDRGLDVYVFFNNDAEGFAVTNALDLKGLVENGMTGA